MVAVRQDDTLMLGDEFLFVYGTLRPGARNKESAEARALLSASARWVGTASVRARLHWVSWHPGLVLSDDPADRVVGDLFELSDQGLLSQLDVFEGDDYARTCVIAQCAGNEIKAWAYVVVRPEKLGDRIALGDFVRAQSERAP